MANCAVPIPLSHASKRIKIHRAELICQENQFHFALRVRESEKREVIEFPLVEFHRERLFVFFSSTPRAKGFPHNLSIKHSVGWGKSESTKMRLNSKKPREEVKNMFNAFSP